jgi:hypothetical protein
LKLSAQSGPLTATQFDPRTGERKDLGAIKWQSGFIFRPPDEQDWVVLLAEVR